MQVNNHWLNDFGRNEYCSNSHKKFSPTKNRQKVSDKVSSSHNEGK